MVTILNVGIDCARKRFTTVSTKPKAKKTAAAKKTTEKAVASTSGTSAKLSTAKPPVVTFHEDGTVVIEGMPPTPRGRQSDYSKAQQVVIEALTAQVTDVQKRLNGLTKDFEAAQQGFERAQRRHAEELEGRRRSSISLHEQLARSTSIGAANSFVIRTTQLLTESFTDVKLVSSDTGYNTAATWQIGELQIDFVGGRNRSFRAISTERAEEQIVPQDIPLGRGLGELTATSISFIRDLLRAITHKGKKKLSAQSAYASWFPSTSPSTSPSPATETPEQHVQLDEQTVRNIGTTAMQGASIDFGNLMEALDGQSHHRNAKGDRKVDDSEQDTAAQATDVLSRGRLKTFPACSNTGSKRIGAVLDVMADSQNSLIEILRMLYTLAELMPIDGFQPDEHKINAVKHTLETATEEELVKALPIALWGMLSRLTKPLI